MESATGSASSCHTGSVASTHCPRVIATGAVASSEIVVASLSHSVARANAWSNSVRSAAEMLSPSLFERCRAWVFAAAQSMPPSSDPCANAACICAIICRSIAGSTPMRERPSSWAGSMSPEPAPPPSRFRSSSWKSSGSKPPSKRLGVSSSAMSGAFQQARRVPFYASRTASAAARSAPADEGPRVRRSRTTGRKGLEWHSSTTG